MKRLLLLALLLGCAPSTSAQPTPANPAPVTTPAPPARDYYFFVASEGNDEVALVKFGAAGARVVRKNKIGQNPTELQGPHGIVVSPDGRYYYVTTAHGAPNGALLKFSTTDDEQVGHVALGMFPATVALTPDGHYAWLVNFNLYGGMVQSSVSVVYTDDMIELKRIPTCVMPHGSRIAAATKKQYSACMMDDVLIEIDLEKMDITRHFMAARGSEHGMAGAPHAHEMAGMTMQPSCSPTWAQPAPGGASVYVACNKSNDIVEVDANTWQMKRRIPAGDGIYNLAVTSSGNLLIGTNKRGKSVSIIDTGTGKEVARVETSRRLPSGLVVSPDDRYVFVTLEGVGSEPGTVDIIDLKSLVRVGSVDVGQQAGGIDFWRME